MQAVCAHCQKDPLVVSLSGFYHPSPVLSGKHSRKHRALWTASEALWLSGVSAGALSKAPHLRQSGPAGSGDISTSTSGKDAQRRALLLRGTP